MNLIEFSVLGIALFFAIWALYLLFVLIVEDK